MSRPLSSTTRGGWRVALRLARREALRRKAQTALMLVLICLPVLAVTAAAIVWRTQDVSSAESVDRRMGSADALVESAGTTRVAQAFDPEQGSGWFGDERDESLELTDVLEVLGADRAAIPFTRDYLEFRTDKGLGSLETISTDLGDPLADGLVEPVDGAFPPGPGEVVVNQAVVDRGQGIGDTLTVVRQTPDGEQTFDLEIVGIAESAWSTGFEFAAGSPGAFGEGDPLTTSWLVGGGPVAWDQVRALNEIGALATSRAVLTDPPPTSALPPEFAQDDASVDQLTITVLALVVVMVLLQVVLLAGPAFAVRAKAQARALALVVAAGGTPRQARRTVLASGVVIGAAGGILGVVLGIGVAVVGVPIAQSFDTSRFGPFDVPWALLALVAAFGFVSAVMAAVVPAVSASRQDVVAVLSGRRGEGPPSVRSPLLGLVLLGGGIAGAVLGAGASSGAGANDMGAVLIAGSALVSVVGMILVVPVAVTLVARLSSRLPLTLRFAARDAARHRTRTVPAVAAVGATVAGVVALGIAVSSQEAANAATYQSQLPDGYGSLALSPDTDLDAVDEILARSVGADRIIDVEGIQTSSDDSELELEFSQHGEALLLSYWSTLGSPYAVAAEVPDHIDLPTADRERADAVLAAGGLVLLHDERAIDDGIQVPTLDGDQVTVDARRWTYDATGEGELTDLGSVDTPAVVIEMDRAAPSVALMAPPLVRELGLQTSVVGKLVRGPISEEAEDDISEAAAALPAAPYFYVERGYQPDEAVRIIQGVLAALGAILMLGGTLTATFLALSDARPDLATMAAVGARPRTRRGVAAAYALVVGGIGALLGAPVGFIPGMAISQPLTSGVGDASLDVPWLLIGMVVLGLPLLTAAAVGACARGRLPLTARVD
ncbi:FtsX-like permease family protein [Nocardioides caeni]|uniref:ABC transporter permease n=1 Tax=Nocardioides caeni TaxID=574700 RepID=A0A4S8N152_9ACTN|nr:ABC transporter permease [Nocardioides caeni]THV09181.1 ABC transporter permease [Nocardioides caeni]